MDPKIQRPHPGLSARAWPRSSGFGNGSSPPRLAPAPWCCRCTVRSRPPIQDRALCPGDRRKVILSTNVAETSLTIDGVTTVIDTGLARIVRYDAERGIDRWELSRISRAAADQRAGRAGRTGPGRCIRLWSEREQRGLADFEQPEIHRVDLCATVLALHAWGTADPARFAWYDPPAPERLAAAERLLVMLGGLAGTPPRITPLGQEMLALPVHPRLARLLVAARHDGRIRDGRRRRRTALGTGHPRPR